MELTESIFLNQQQISFIRKSIDRMHQLGFLCSIDDFGSGYSSLGMLKDFDIDTVKLDRSFFAGISDEKTQDIIACITELAEKLGAKTVAEGIETEEQLSYLRSVACDMVQGYIFSKPLPEEEFESWKKEFEKKSQC